MKLSTIVTVTVLGSLIAVGCTENVQQEDPNRRLFNTQLVNSFSDIAMQNAIISEHTLYPYHFVKNGADLNELGQRDLAVLTKHFMQNPGRLNVRQDSISADVYEARVNTVLDQMKEAGIDTERVNISDGMPGGSGMPSETVLIILEKAREATPAQATTTFRPGGTGY
jgi:hypothetical protein